MGKIKYDKRSKVLTIIPNMDFGGAQKVFNTLNNSLNEDFEIVECVFNKEDGYIYKTKNKVYDLQVSAGKNVFYKLFNFLKRIVRFRKLIKEIKPDIIISHLEGADYVSLLTLIRVKKICVIHGSKYNDKKIIGFMGSIRKRVMIPFVYGLADRIVTVSEALISELKVNIRISPKKLTYIYNSVDKNIIQQLSHENIDLKYEHLFSTRTLVTSCRLDQTHKNLYGMIDIYKNLSQREEIKLVIIGDGADREAVLQYAKENRLTIATVWENTLDNKSADVYFLGYHSNPFPFIRRADIFLLTSFYEGFPLGILEAMACGTRVIASNCPTGPSEILMGDEINDVKELNVKVHAGVLMPIPTNDKFDTIKIWTNTIDELLTNDLLKKKILENSDNVLNSLNPLIIHQKWKRIIKETIE